MRRAVEAFCGMTGLHDQLPLLNHRARVAEYLRGVTFPSGSVAARIIAERPSADHAAAPLRPSLVLWACDAGSGDLADAIPVAAAFALFDRFLLLHEELADETAAVIARWGLGQSLNAGDALYALAFRTLCADVVESRRRVETARLVGEAVLGAIAKRDAVVREGILTEAALAAGAAIAAVPGEAARAFARAGRLLAAAAMIGEPARARRESERAVALLRPWTAPGDAALFEEVARHVARRAA